MLCQITQQEFEFLLDGVEKIEAALKTKRQKWSVILFFLSRTHSSTKDHRIILKNIVQVS